LYWQNLLEFETNGGHRVSARRESSPVKLRLSIQPGYGDSALHFQEPDHLGHRVLGRNSNTHVLKAGHQVAFEDLALLLPCQGVKDRAQ
jgi:hypothetical protein